MKTQSYFQHSNAGSVIQSLCSKASIKGEKNLSNFKKILCNIINSLSSIERVEPYFA